MVATHLFFRLDVGLLLYTLPHRLLLQLLLHLQLEPLLDELGAVVLYNGGGSTAAIQLLLLRRHRRLVLHLRAAVLRHWMMLMLLLVLEEKILRDLAAGWSQQLVILWRVGGGEELAVATAI
jgi:hypothetical protein